MNGFYALHQTVQLTCVALQTQLRLAEDFLQRNENKLYIADHVGLEAQMGGLQEFRDRVTILKLKVLNLGKEDSEESLRSAEAYKTSPTAALEGILDANFDPGALPRKSFKKIEELSTRMSVEITKLFDTLLNECDVLMARAQALKIRFGPKN